MPISAERIPAARSFERKLDTHGVLDYTTDWSVILGSELELTDVQTFMSPEAEAAGVQIVNYIHNVVEKSSTVRLMVLAENQNDVGFDTPGGVDVSFKSIATDDTGQKWGFSFRVTVERQ